MSAAAAVGPAFPPLLEGRACFGDPREAAVAAARAGCDAGLVLYDAAGPDLAAAVVLAPDVPLSDAAAMLPLGGVALQNALGAVGPSEVAVQLDWEGRVLVNGGRAGRLGLLGPPTAPDAVPDWLVLSVDLRFAPLGENGGATPDETALHAEGCGDLGPLDVLESFSRHLLTWIHLWEEDGMAPLHRDWTGLAVGIGEPARLGGVEGTLLGVDERLGALVKTGGGTRLLPLSDLVETR